MTLRLVAALLSESLLSPSATLTAQTFFVGGSGGYQRARTDRSVYGGEMGVHFNGPVEVRLEGFEMMRLFFLGPAVSCDVLPAGKRLVPFVTAGGGIAIELFSPVKSWVQVGGGLRAELMPHLALTAATLLTHLEDAGRNDPTSIMLRVGLRLHTGARP